MSDPVYEPPKTDPREKGVKFREVPLHKVSTKKVMIYTLTPSLVLLLGGLASGGSFEFFMFTAFIAPILALLFSVLTAIELSKGKEPLVLVGHIILFIAAHAILLFLGLFIGCGIGASNF